MKPTPAHPRIRLAGAAYCWSLGRIQPSLRGHQFSMRTIGIKLQASGIIANPWFTLPPRIITTGGPSSTIWDNKPDITPKSRIELEEHGITLCFQTDEIEFAFSTDREEPRYFVTPIQYFIGYRTFINYNITWPVVDHVEVAGFPLVDAIDFRRVESVEAVPKSAISTYLQVLDEPLHYAIAFYLIGCENLRYFLVEFYKAVEAIENHLGGERRCLEVLSPHGVERSVVKEFKAQCNDMFKAPLDIGRHAPAPGAPVYAVDLRNLLGRPRSRELFEQATVACRQVIDGYLKFREASA